MTDYTILRDYWDRPLVWEPGAEPLAGLEKRTGRDRKTGREKAWHGSKQATGYRRASSAGKGLDTSENLIPWAAAQAAVGVVLDDAAKSGIAALVNEFEGDPWNKGDTDDVRSGKIRLNEFVDQARKRAGSEIASTAGTEFHGLGELVNKGKTPRVVQEHLKPKLEHYQERVAPIEFLRQELFVVNDRLQLAGSVDYLMRLPAGLTTPDGVKHESGLVVAGDLKTGKWDFMYPMPATCQVAAYGTAQVYDQATNTRSPLHPDVSTKWGLLVHYPIMREGSEVRFYWLDLELGVEAAELGRQVELMRNRFNRRSSELVEVTF